MTQPASAVDRFVFDACALIAYFTDEEGAEKAEHLIEQAQAGKSELYVASVNVYEVFYNMLRSESPERAEEILKDLDELPVTVVEIVDRALMRHAAHFKIKFKMSFADSIALGLSKQLGAKLVTTDHHELDVVEKSGEAQFFWLR